MIQYNDDNTVTIGLDRYLTLAALEASFCRLEKEVKGTVGQALSPPGPPVLIGQGDFATSYTPKPSDVFSEGWRRFIGRLRKAPKNG